MKYYLKQFANLNLCWDNNIFQSSDYILLLYNPFHLFFKEVTEVQTFSSYIEFCNGNIVIGHKNSYFYVYFNDIILA